MDGMSKESDHNLYLSHLTQLLIQSHITNNPSRYLKTIIRVNYFSFERFRMSGKFTPAPVNTKERAIIKAKLDYKLCGWHTRHVLDLLKCSVLFDSVDD